jgi:hypothetical protein
MTNILKVENSLNRIGQSVKSSKSIIPIYMFTELEPLKSLHNK